MKIVNHAKRFGRASAQYVVVNRSCLVNTVKFGKIEYSLTPMKRPPSGKWIVAAS